MTMQCVINNQVYNLDNKIPKILQTLSKPFMNDSSYEFHEESWNAYPHLKTVLTKPGQAKENFCIEIESVHHSNIEKQTRNVLSHSKPDEIQTLDIFK